MAVLGDKRTAKDYLSAHAPEIPLIPGYNGSEQSVERLTKEAGRIGFPILIKASAGGGGKGMRIVHEESRLKEELKRAQSEAQRSFGSSDCILERYIQRSKHIEMQIVGDSHGNVVSLLDRECSIQRRHQKVIEEAPSPWLTEELRVKMSNTAVAIGKLLKYESAGTVEFIVDVQTSEFFFLEVNTRIQVEHPITEETTGVDMVELQLFVATGGDLNDTGYFENGRAKQVGHAIECRLCAEDPARDFLPDHGFIRLWSPASTSLPSSAIQDVRWDTGIGTSSQISVFFDSLIAKIVVWAPSRAAAVEKMAKMMAYTVCIGIRTNQQFLQSCLLHPAFRDPAYSTSFIPENITELLRNPYVADVAAMQEDLAVIPSLIRTAGPTNFSRKAAARPFRSIQPSFRNQKGDHSAIQYQVVEIPSIPERMIFIDAAPSAKSISTFHIKTIPINKAEQKAPGIKDAKPSNMLAAEWNRIMAQVQSQHTSADGSARAAKLVDCKIRPHTTMTTSTARDWLSHNIVVTINGRRHHAICASEPSSSRNGDNSAQRVYVHMPHLGTYVTYDLHTQLSFGSSLRKASAEESVSKEKNPRAPMPCKILGVVKKDGDTIEVGEVGVVVESMKMEMSILATAKGIFKSCVNKGEAVEEGTVLFNIS